MKSFKDFGIKTDLQSFVGDKVKISKVLNREIVVHDYKIEDSKFGDNKKRLVLQVEIGDIKHIVFTGSIVLMDMVQKVPKSGFPFRTTIIEENERYEFS